MIDKLTAGMKSWIKQDYHDICESPAEYGISDAEKEFGGVFKRSFATGNIFFGSHNLFPLVHEKRMNKSIK